MSASIRGDIEKRIVGTLLANALQDTPMLDMAIMKGVEPKHFTYPAARAAFEAITGGARTFTAVQLALMPHFGGDDGRAVDWLGDAISEPYGGAGLRALCDELIGMTRRELAISAVQRIGSSLVNGNPDAESMQAAMSDLSAGLLAPEFKSSRETIQSAFDRAAELVRADNPHPIGIKAIDDVRDYSEPGTTLVIGGETGMGKSTLARQMFIQWARAGVPCLYYSLEDPNEKLAASVVCAIAGISYNDFAHNRASSIQREAVARALAEVLTWPVPPMLAVAYEATVSRIKADVASIQDRPLAVFIDHLGLMTHANGQTVNEQLAQTSRALRLMAIQERLSMVVLAQLNKQPGNREDGEPIISDLRDCGMIGADASDIILVWAPMRDAGQQSRYIKVAKNRHGPTIGKLELEFRRNSGGWLSVPDRPYETGREYQS